MTYGLRHSDSCCCASFFCFSLDSLEDLFMVDGLVVIGSRLWSMCPDYFVVVFLQFLVVALHGLA